MREVAVQFFHPVSLALQPLLHHMEQVYFSCWILHFGNSCGIAQGEFRNLREVAGYYYFHCGWFLELFREKENSNFRAERHLRREGVDPNEFRWLGVRKC